MKIKEVLRELLSGEDFSDHSTGKEEGHSPLHDKGCRFCDAWRAALYLLTQLNIIDFEPGDPVTILGGVRGRVISLEYAARVEVQYGEHGPWAVGTFQPGDLSHRAAEEPSRHFVTDCQGDVWLLDKATSRALLVASRDGTVNYPPSHPMLTSPVRWHSKITAVATLYGPLTKTDSPW